MNNKEEGTQSDTYMYYYDIYFMFSKAKWEASLSQIIHLIAHFL